MIGGHRHGINVFFLREDEGVGVFPEVCVDEVNNNYMAHSRSTRWWPSVKDMPWREVEMEVTSHG
jgi:hypothetical protein